MTASDYPITELFGCQSGYPLNTNVCPPGQGFHNGIDYGCPTGTPIVVNGIEIGISGATGYVTGPHCHVGKWVGGKAQDPGAGNGFTFTSAIVTEVNEDSTNGKYVRVQGDGASWVYLHMSNNSLVKVGQVLEGSNMQAEIDELNTQLNSTNKQLEQTQTQVAEQSKQLDSTNQYLDKLTKRVAALEQGAGGDVPSDGDYSLKRIN